MKKLIFLILVITSAGYSQSYNLNISLKNGNTLAIPVDEIQKIIFNTITDVKGIGIVQLVIESFKVMQNYPNPFNPTTTISYRIPKTSNVKVNVYDINGQLINEIVNETQSAGEYHVTWNAANQNGVAAASGVYIYTVRSDDQIISKQMILIK